jgi:hypothetical protein
MQRILWAAAGVFLLVMAFIATQQDRHLINTQIVQSRDGTEAVGDEASVNGPDYGNAVLLGMLSAIPFYIAFKKRSDK